VTRVRIGVGDVTGRMQVVVMRALRKDNPSDPGHPTFVCCTAVRTTGVLVPRPDAITTFRVRLPVVQSRRPSRAGYYTSDFLALSVLDPNVPIPGNSDANATLSGWAPALTRGEERFGTSGFMITLRATWMRS